jgi:hypothetical protein
MLSWVRRRVQINFHDDGSFVFQVSAAHIYAFFAHQLTTGLHAH